MDVHPKHGRTGLDPYSWNKWILHPAINATTLNPRVLAMVEGKMYSTANPCSLGLKNHVSGSQIGTWKSEKWCPTAFEFVSKYGFPKCNGLFFIFPIETAILGYTWIHRIFSQAHFKKNTLLWLVLGLHVICNLLGTRWIQQPPPDDPRCTIFHDMIWCIRSI